MNAQLPADAVRLSQLAKELGIPRERMREWVRRGRLQGYGVPGYLRSPVYVSRGDVRQLLGIAESSPAQSGS